MEQTADQIRQLASLVSRMSSTVDEYRMEHFEQLAPEERLRLEQLFQQLCDVHDEFTALAIQNTLDGIRSDLDGVLRVTAQAQQALAHLHTIGEITNLVSATAELAARLSVGDYGAVPLAIEDIMQALPKRSDR